MISRSVSLFIWFQRYSVPNVATQLALPKSSWSPEVSSLKSLRTDNETSHSFYKRIETNLPHDGLNPIHVTLSTTNSSTFGCIFTSRLSWIDIEVPTLPIDQVSQGRLACYPWRTFDSLSDNQSSLYYQITRLCSSNISHTCLSSLSHSQVFICSCALPMDQGPCEKTH